MTARILCLVIGYAFGLLQTSYLLGKIAGIDIRKKGSGNAGTTNAIRTLGGKVVSAETLDIPLFERKHMLIVIRKERPTDAAYPRPNGRIKKKPL